MAQRFISFYYLASVTYEENFDINIINKIFRNLKDDEQFNNIATQDDYLKEHNLNCRIAVPADKITIVSHAYTGVPVFYTLIDDRAYFLSYSEGNKLIDLLLTINDYKK